MQFDLNDPIHTSTNNGSNSLTDVALLPGRSINTHNNPKEKGNGDNNSEKIEDVFNPTHPKGQFNIWARYYIITYRSHLPKQPIIDYFMGILKTKIVRVAHEIGTKTINYEHSHVFVDFGKQFKSQNSRIFDYNGIHPNIGPISKMKHLERVYRYMSKYDKANVDMLTWIENGTSVRDIWEYPTLQDAVKHAEKITDVTGIIAAYSLKPQAEIEIQPWEFEWQAHLEIQMSTLSQPRRQIWWYVDVKGGAGKTDFAKGMMDRYPKDTYVFTQFGGGRDAATIVINALNAGWTGKYCIIDLPRDAETKAIYEPMEMIRNGMITAIKYSGMTVRFTSNWMIVMANFAPEFGHMSADRWVVIHMNGNPKFGLRCDKRDVVVPLPKEPKASFEEMTAYWIEHPTKLRPTHNPRTGLPLTTEDLELFDSKKLFTIIY